MPNDLPSSATRPKHHRGEIIITTDTSTSGADWQLDPDGGSISLPFYWEISKQRGTFRERFTPLQTSCFWNERILFCLSAVFLCSQQGLPGWTQCMLGNALEVLREGEKTATGWRRKVAQTHSKKSSTSHCGLQGGHSKTQSMFILLFKLKHTTWGWASPSIPPRLLWLLQQTSCWLIS